MAPIVSSGWGPILDPTFRVIVAEPRSLHTNYTLSELVNVIPGNDPNRSDPVLGSTAPVVYTNYLK